MPKSETILRKTADEKHILLDQRNLSKAIERSQKELLA